MRRVSPARLQLVYRPIEGVLPARWTLDRDHYRLKKQTRGEIGDRRQRGKVFRDISKALFVSAYKRLVGGNKRESRQTFCLFPPILAYVVSRFRDLNYEKQKARKSSLRL